MRKSMVLGMGVFISVILAACFLMSGCSNMSMGIGSYTFRHVHFSDAVSGHCATVEKWYDNSTGVEVKTSEYGPIFLSEGSYAMFNDASKCPYCQ